MSQTKALNPQRLLIRKISV